MKHLAAFLLLIASSAYGQKVVSRKDILGHWFVSNIDSAFFLADTMTLIKHTNRERRDDIKVKERQFLEPVTDLIKATEYANLRFFKNNQCDFWLSHYGGYMNEAWPQLIWWRYRSGKIHIESRTLKWDYRILTKGKVKFIYKVSNSPVKYDTLETITLRLRRID